MNLSTFLTKFEKNLGSVSKWLMYVGIIPLFLMCFLTVWDVFMGKLFKMPISGNLEIVAALQVLAISLAAVLLQVKGGHTRVDFVVQKLAGRAQIVTDSLALLASLAFVILLTCTSFTRGQELLTAGEVTSTVKIPLFLLTYVMAICFGIISFVLLSQFLGRVTKLRRKL